MLNKPLPCPCGNKDTKWSSTEADETYETYCAKCGDQSVCGQWVKNSDQPVSVNRPSRIEVIDHRVSAPDFGRLPPKAIDVSWQDDDRTLKIFIKD